MLTYEQIKDWVDINHNTNGVAGITGALQNEMIISYLLANFPNLTYDTTRPYLTGQHCYYHNGTFGAYYVANADTTGVFDSTKWDNVSPLMIKLTQTINIGANAIAHGLGKTPDIIYIKSSTGANIPFDVESSNSTTININSLAEYTNAVISIIAQ